MMLLHVFSVYDSKIGAYLQPFFLQTKPAAIRAITDCVRDPEHRFGQHPEDYVLFHLGTYEDNTGVWGINPSPEVMAGGHELLNPEGSEKS